MTITHHNPYEKLSKEAEIIDSLSPTNRGRDTNRNLIIGLDNAISFNQQVVVQKVILPTQCIRYKGCLAQAHLCLFGKCIVLTIFSNHHAKRGKALLWSLDRRIKHDCM